MIFEPVFFGENDWIPQPRDRKAKPCQGKYDLEVGEGRRIWEACLERTRRARPQMLGAEGAPRFGAPFTCGHDYCKAPSPSLSPRPTGEPARLPRNTPFPCWRRRTSARTAREGAHYVSQGILLRRDVHRPFDLGNVTVTAAFRFEVSKQLDQEWHNGKD